MIFYIKKSLYFFYIKKSLLFFIPIIINESYFEEMVLYKVR